MSLPENRKAVWEKLQPLEEERYQAAYRTTGNYAGFFSEQSRTDAKRIGEYIAESCSICLDVGAGILPRPAYMQQDTNFFGLDPFFGEYEREFPFVQAIGEDLPFLSETFECVTFMSTLDHQIEPLMSLKEAHRVLMPHGKLFLWVQLWRENQSRQYRHWRKAPVGTLFDRHHQHAFAKRDIEALMTDSQFQLIEDKNISMGRYKSRLIIGEKQ